MKAVQQKWFVIVAMAVMLCLTGMVMSGTAFAQECVDNDNGTVTDKGTGLMWQQATAGPMNWDQAMSYASGLSLGGHSDWWLPSRDELMGLFKSPCKNMMYVKSSLYWSSTTNAYNTNDAWHVDFNDGYVDYVNKSLSCYVRAVRSAQ